MAGAGDWGRSMNPRGKALGWWVLRGEREGEAPWGGCFLSVGWPLHREENRGRIARGQEVTRSRMCNMCSRLLSLSLFLPHALFSMLSK